MQLFMTLGLPIEAYESTSGKRRVVRFEGVTLYDYENRQDYHFHGDDWLARRKLFEEQYAALKPVTTGSSNDVIRISKADWSRTKGGKLKKVGA